MKRVPAILSACALLSACTGMVNGSEDYISAEQIDRIVAEQAAQFGKAYIRINGRELLPHDMHMGEQGLMFDTEFGRIVTGFTPDGRSPGPASVSVGQRDANREFVATDVFSIGDVRPQEFENGFTLSGVLENDAGASIDIDMRINEAYFSAGATTVTVDEQNVAHIRGVLGTRAYLQIKDLVTNRPEVVTLQFDDVPGSVNDSVNVHTGRLIREAGLTTLLRSDGVIASGGVDLFVSGLRRIVERGGEVGVHSWCCVGRKTAAELPVDHAAHRSQKEYFATMLGERLGTGFYFYTLESAPFDGIHWMSVEDIEKWSIATVVTGPSH